MVSPPRSETVSPPLTSLPSKRITSAIASLLSKGVITPSTRDRCLWLSPVFTRINKDASYRLILNLKCLNSYIAHIHFKMESLTDVLRMLKPVVWMASVDLHHAYYSIPVAAHHQPYFSFSWQGAYYQYSCLPNGYALAPMLFTKVLRPPFAYLRRQGHISVVYMDDTYLQGDSIVFCQRNVYATVINVNDKKSVFIPTQTLEFLGFILDSLLMTITLTARRKVAFLNACSKPLQKSRQKMRAVFTVIGMIIAALPGVKHGALHYRSL